VPVRDDPATYNVGSGRSFSVREIAELVERAAAIQKPIVVRGSPRIGEIPDAVADIAAIRAVGWRPRIGLVEGLRDLVAERQRSSDTIV
jgi:GDP-L-fucose synthase